jgi:hypothetical protein
MFYTSLDNAVIGRRDILGIIKTSDIREFD